MIMWVWIISSEMVGSCGVLNGIKMTAQICIDFLKADIEPGFKKKLNAYRKNIIFMHDNVLSHFLKEINEYLNKMI